MRDNHLPLTETVFYLLLVFEKPLYGYLAMQEIENISGGEIRVAAGTMYGAIENLLKVKMLTQLSSQNERRKMYQTTPYGKKVLAEEVARQKRCVRLFEAQQGGGVRDEK